ncbi:MAG: glycosyltransferase family 2 protein [Candidatus Baltobacteraceae bacterium]
MPVAFAAVQGLLGARVFARMLASAAGDPIQAVAAPPPGAGTVSVVVPVLDERARLAPALDGLCAQGPWVREILVVDGGSRDGTQALVRDFMRREPRLRLVDASPVPEDWNGKAWGLATGLARSAPEATWIAFVDADVRPSRDLTASLLAHARASYLEAFSAAPRLELSGAAEALVHPALLATLVYRFGLPGSVATRPRRVQANGQCFFAKRSVLVASGAIAGARASRCEDVTIARRLVRAGVAVGFFEGGRLATVRMYEGLEECWRNWPRSLTMRDAETSNVELLLELAEVAFVQALPLALATVALARGQRGPLAAVNAGLALARLGVLWGTRRAYAAPPPSYWLSPAFDLPVAARLIASAFGGKRAWRGRPLVAERRAA